MLWPVLIAGFTLGAVGSLHCIGMCGPLSLALPTQHLSQGKRFLSLISYQLGRILTYSLLGFLFGLAGSGISMTGFQQQFSIVLGTTILLLAIMYWIRKTSFHIALFNDFYFYIQKLIGRLLYKVRGPSGFLAMGVANGFLPCGLVYVAIAGALTSPNITNGVLFMAMFGAGTMPAMLFVGYLGRIFSIPLRQTMRKLVPIFITAMGIILILRGLNLGIPFISPELPQQLVGETVNCHG